MSVDKAVQAIQDFQGASLTENLSKIETEIVGIETDKAFQFCDEIGVDANFLNLALSIKSMASQINVIIHAAGILHSLKTLLDDGERVESVSLGAGNTGKKFDLETNFRVAEYKFIDWKGGAEAIRQNGIFKDFYELAEHETTKKKYLYVVDTTHPLRFFNGGRALTSVLSRYPNMIGSVSEKYGKDIQVVRDYYALHKDTVSICDVRPHIARM